jgi:hypothetical protein
MSPLRGTICNEFSPPMRALLTRCVQALFAGCLRVLAKMSEHGKHSFRYYFIK